MPEPDHPLEDSFAAEERPELAPEPELKPEPEPGSGLQPESTFSAPVEETPPPAPLPAAPGPERLGQFRLDRVVGSGGMGVVYEAWDEDLMRRVAVKVLAPAVSNQVALQRFAQEAMLAARLQHPNIVSVFEAGQGNGRAFIAMEYVQGDTLEAKIDACLGEAAGLEGDARETARASAVARMSSQELQEICRWVRDVARALHCGHTSTAPESDQPAPIIHRDVKPGNIMVDDRGQARLLDYGLAKEMGVALTVTREALGTPLYMSPEQLFSARRVGPRSDVYSLGMTLYACVTLARPFELSSPGQLFEHLLHDEPIDPARLHPGLPDDVRTIILEATAKDERRRYASAEALAEDLDAYLSGRPIQARPPGVWRRTQRWVRRRWKPLAAAATGLALVTGLWIDSELEQDRLWAQQQAGIQARAQAQSLAKAEAASELADAGMLYGLAALSKAEDPQGERWLKLLNQGHDREQSADERLRLKGLDTRRGGYPPSLRRAKLMARAARNDRQAIEEMRSWQRKVVSESERAAEIREILGWLPARIKAEGRELLRALAALDPNRRPPLPGNPRLEPEAMQVRAVLGSKYVDSILGPVRLADDPGPYLARIQRKLEREEEELRDSARLERELSDSLAEFRVAQQIVVAPPKGGGDLTGARVEIVACQQGAPTGRPLATGELGEVLQVDAAGEFLARVRQGGQEARLPLRLPRLGWGAPRTIRRVQLPALPSDAPADMVLVTAPGQRPFWIDRHEVTLSEYARFVRDCRRTQHAACPAQERRDHPDGKDHSPSAINADPRSQDPVTGIDYYDALAYAAWAGKQLPTAAEWETAARGPFPLHTLGANVQGIDDGYLWAAPADAGHLAPCGARGLLGNVSEWLAREDEDLPFCLAAGPGWSDPAPSSPQAALLRFDPRAEGADLGFRCVRRFPAPPAEGPLAPEIVSERDGAKMVLVEAGTYTVTTGKPRRVRGKLQPPGSPQLVTPRSSFELPAYYVDAEPVSYARFARYLEATGQAPRDLVRQGLSRNPDAPLQGVSWEQAQAYASWAGKRLCSEAELLTARSLGRAEPTSDPASKKPRSALLEWCADTWHPAFFEFANRRAPLNRWAPENGHVVRQGLHRSKNGGKRSLIGFRCAFSPQTGDDQ